MCKSRVHYRVYQSCTTVFIIPVPAAAESDSDGQKLSLSQITFMIFSIWWWMHVQYFEDGKTCKNADYYFIWKCVLWHPKEYSFLIPFLYMCSSHELSAMNPYGNNFPVRRWLPFYPEKKLHENHRKLQKKVPVIVWKHCGLRRWKTEHGFASKFYKLLETWMNEKQMQILL